MAESGISTSDLLSYVLDGLFDSISEETLQWNWPWQGEFFDQYSDNNDYESYSIKHWEEQHTLFSVWYITAHFTCW